MNNPFITKKSINRIYRPIQKNLYSHKFFEDLSTGFSFILSEKNEKNDFFAFEPSGCVAERLLGRKNYHDFNARIEQTINMVMYSLLAYGRAHIYLQPQYVSQVLDEDKKMPTDKIFSTLDIVEIKGRIKRKIGNRCIFYCKEFNGEITERELSADGLISLYIKELGYSKKYFPNLLKKLGKCEVIDLRLMYDEQVKGYDYLIHSKKKRCIFLKKTKSIGWTFGNNDLSDSYILYRKILQDKFKIKALEYILNKINEGLSICIHNEDPGKLIAHIRKLNYDDIWRQYLFGEITATKLTNILFKKY